MLNGQIIRCASHVLQMYPIMDDVCSYHKSDAREKHIEH